VVEWWSGGVVEWWSGGVLNTFVKDVFDKTALLIENLICLLPCQAKDRGRPLNPDLCTDNRASGRGSSVKDV
jgi:hypothetical protein